MKTYSITHEENAKINNEKSKRMAKINKINNIKSQWGFSLITGQS